MGRSLGVRACVRACVGGREAEGERGNGVEEGAWGDSPQNRQVRQHGQARRNGQACGVREVVATQPFARQQGVIYMAEDEGMRVKLAHGAGSQQVCRW